MSWSAHASLFRCFSVVFIQSHGVTNEKDLSRVRFDIRERIQYVSDSQLEKGSSGRERTTARQVIDGDGGRRVFAPVYAPSVRSPKICSNERCQVPVHEAEAASATISQICFGRTHYPTLCLPDISGSVSGNGVITGDFSGIVSSPDVG